MPSIVLVGPAGDLEVGLRALGVTVVTIPSCPTLDDGVAAAQRALREARGADELLAIAGSGRDAAVAAVVAGRDSRVRAAVLIEPPAELDGARRPLVEVSRTRARVLLVGGDAERYAAVLSQARVRHEMVALAQVPERLLEALRPRTVRQ